MERFKETLNVLRSEAERANAASDEFKALIKQYENEEIQKEHEIASLRIKTQVLERTLEDTLSNIKLVSHLYQEAKNREYAIEKIIEEINLDLENAEKRNDDLKESTRIAKEELEEYERQLDGY